MRHLLTKALILRKQTSGENDWYLTLFSPEIGKIQALARSSRKICSQKGAHLDTLNLCNFQLYRNNDRYLVTDCRVENAHLPIKSSLRKSLMGFAVSEMLLRTVQEETENQELFQLTLKTLENIGLESENTDLQLEEFKIKLLKEAGSWPDISLCYYCQSKCCSEQAYFCDCEGHLCCHHCLSCSHNEMDPVTFHTIKLAKFLADKNDLLVNLKITPEQLFSLKKLTAIFLQNYLHRELYSERYLQS